MANALTAYSMRWEIENISNCWWLRKERGILCPPFIVDAWEGSSFSILLYPLGYSDENYVGIFLHRNIDSSGPDAIEVSYQLAILGKDGSVLKEDTVPKHIFTKIHGFGFPHFEKREKVFVSEREAFLPEDILTVQCTIWTTYEKPEKSNHLFATTAIKVKRRSFAWKIDKPRTLKSTIRNKFKDNLIGFDLVLSEGFDRLEMCITSFDNSIQYILCNASIIDCEGKKENFGIKKYLSDDLAKEKISSILSLPEMLLENKSRYFPNDVLSLDFKFAISTVENSYYEKSACSLENETVRKEKYDNTAVPTEDFKLLFNDGIFSDAKLRTSTKTFPVHKGVLSVRSPVFRSMFSTDMKEKDSGQVDIIDFEEDTVHRMLLYIYTDSLEDLQFESASKLYRIADKYQILVLKSRCSSFLKENLCPKNACDVLVLADLHSDDNLKNAVEDYILRQCKEVVCSEEWKYFMNTHLKLAADLMYRKITNSKIDIPRKRKSDTLSP